MNKKQFLILSITTILFGNCHCQAYTDYDKDENYTWTEKETDKKIKNLIKKAITSQGWFSRYYEPGTETNGKRILRKVKQKSKKEEANSKIVKRFHPERTKKFAKQKIMEELKQIIMERVEYVDLSYECIKEEIVSRIIYKIENTNDLRNYLNNDFIDKKIEYEIQIYQAEQNTIMYTMPTAPEMSICNKCRTYVGHTGTAYLMNCNNHEYCSDCYMEQQYPWVCGNCHMQKGTNFCDNCMTGDYCYLGCPECLLPAEPSIERYY